MRETASAAARAESRKAPKPAERGRPAPPGRASMGFPIVAIGASAGGLEVFKRFFSHMPADSGLAFVLIPHLDPTHKSLMVDLIAKATTMPVLEAEHRMLVRANHVYVIPPNKYLAFRHRRLMLSEVPIAHAGQTAIDFALRSLADDEQENAIGIVFSGTGSHGTEGLKEIKIAGGLVMVQDPKTAQHQQMPRSALASGMGIDFVLAPEEMPQALIAYAKQRSLHHYAEAEPADTRALDDLRPVLALLQTRAKTDFRYYRKNMILRRTRRRMALVRVADIQDYVARLRQDPDELLALRRDLLIGVTTFFRTPKAFDCLAKEVLPELIRRASADAPLRVWVPACSTGEEAYSIAIILFEQFEAARKPSHVQIFATDVDEESLKIARRGTYPDSIAGAVSPERLQRYFARTELNQYQVRKQVRDTLIFAPHNLVSDPPFSKLDLISCRNVLIYLETDVQARVLSLLNFGLKEGGYLALGPAESVGVMTNLFEPVSRKWRIFRRTGPFRHQPLIRPAVPAATQDPERPEPLPRPAARGVELMRRLLLEEFAPAAVLVTRKYEILTAQGPVDRYLHIPAGPVTYDLLAMTRDNLRAAIRAACGKALKSGEIVRDADVRVRRDGHYRPCAITVRPIARHGRDDNLLLIVFEDIATAGRPAAGRANRVEAGSARRLEAELRATRSDLQSTIAELEGANEELQASNEEVMSMNEELQSANEELESSKEELQSLNEELTTVNNQLEEKVTDLDAANNDLTNLTAATEIAIVFLDTERRIRRFTEPAGRLLNLLPGDVGRPFDHLAPTFADHDLGLDAQRVMSTGVPLEREVLSNTNRWYLRRILPYRADAGPIGIVVTFVDITDRVAARTRDAESAEARLRTILDTASDAIVSADSGGRVLSFNKAATRVFGYAEQEVLGQNVSMLMPPVVGSAHDGYIKRFVTTREPHIIGQSRALTARRKDGTLFPVRLTLAEAEDQGLFVASIRDETTTRAMQEEIVNIALLEQRRIGQELHDHTQQELTGLTMLAEQLNEALRQQGATEPAELSRRIGRGLAETGQQVRDLAHGLIPVPVDADSLPAALRALAANTARQHKLACDFHGPGDATVGDTTIATHLYRIAQEAVSNAVRHSKARAIKLRLLRSKADVRLEIEDDGIGFEPKKTGTYEGVGLRLMEYRCGVIGGNFEISARPGGGTLVTCAIPLLPALA